MNNSTKTVLICAPVRDRAWILRDYLDALYGLEYPKESIGFYFLLNDSEDQSEDILMEFKEKHEAEYKQIVVVKTDLFTPKDTRKSVVRRTVYGNLARLRNHLLGQVGEYDYVFSVDTDIVVEKECLRELVGADKDVCAVVIANDYGKGKIHNILNWIEAVGNIKCRHVLDFPKDTFFKVGVTGAVVLIKREVCDNVAYGWHVQGEDIEFCRDAMEKGYEVWACSKKLAEHRMMKL